MSNNNSNQLPPGFIDALLGYAMDPTQWHLLAQELEQRGDALETINPSNFMEVLSQAESVAWHIRNEPPTQITGCVYILLDDAGQVLPGSSRDVHLEQFLQVSEAVIHFTHPDSARAFTSAFKELARGSSRSELVELKSSDETRTRFAYLISAASLPHSLQKISDQCHCAILLADNEPNDKVRRLLQRSFGLTSAETAVCLRLSSGQQLKEVADSLNISTNTARNHLQSVFEKTHVNRQSDLLLMLTQLSVVLAVVVDRQKENTQASSALDYPGHQFALIDDQQTPRRVAYRVYGSGGRHVVYFHESAGTSRLLPGTQDLADELGLTIIAIERPGTGFSDPVENYDFANTAADIAHILNHLELNQVSFLAFMSGASHALGAAALLGNQISKILLVAGRGPSPYPTNEKNPLAILRRRLMAQPWLLSTFFNILRNRTSEETNSRALKQIYGNTPHDLHILETREDLLSHMAHYTMESMVISGAGIIGEINCYTKPSSIELDKISAPITVWHGDADTISPVEGLLDSIHELQPQVRMFERHGSLILLEYWREVLEFMAA